MKQLLFLTIFIFPLTVKSQTCDCYIDFKKMREKVEINYSGFRDKVTDSNKTKYQTFTNDIENKVLKNKNFKQCTKLMREWLSFFNDRHMFLYVNNSYEIQPTFSPTFYRIDEKTVELKIPSFDYHYKTKVDSIINANDSIIKSTPYLIIDITDNRGGSDATYSNILPYIYTNPIVLDGVEFWVTPDNLKIYENLSIDTTRDKETRKDILSLISKMKNNLYSFINPMETDTFILKYDTVYGYPKKVGIIIDVKNASSAEQFLIEAKQSKKVIMFGTTHTSGTLDYSNVFPEPLPSNKRGIGIPTSRSKRLPINPFDPYGISPNVKINKNIKDKTKFIMDYLKQQ